RCDVACTFYRGIVDEIGAQRPAAPDLPLPLAIHAAEEYVAVRFQGADTDYAVNLDSLGGFDGKSIQHIPLDLDESLEGDVADLEIHITGNLVDVFDRDLVSVAIHTSRCLCINGRTVIRKTDILSQYKLDRCT